MIQLRDSWEIERIQKSSQIVRDTLEKLHEFVKPGISTLELDSIAEDYIKSQDAIPGFKGLYGFPSTVCASVDVSVALTSLSTTAASAVQALTAAIEISGDIAGSVADTGPANDLSRHSTQILYREEN